MIGTQVGSPTARRRTARVFPAFVITAALLVTGAACDQAPTRPAPPAAGASPATAGGTAARSGGTAALSGATAAPSGGALSVLSASFVSPSAGWLLATPCPSCRTVVMRKTTDGGRTWTAVPAPDAPPADQSTPPATAVGTILFTSAGTGWAFGPALWQTGDGGGTWRKMSVPGPVRDLAAAGNRVLAVTNRCGASTGASTGACRFQVYSAALGSDDWRAVPGAAGSDDQQAVPGAVGPGSARLVVSDGVGYVFAVAAGQGRPVLLAGPVNGSARWRPVPDPCVAASSGALAAAPGGWLFLGCGGEPGVGEQVKAAWLSGNGGHSWHQVARPPSGGYLGGASMSSGGTIFLFGARMNLYVSPDRGRGWLSPTLPNAAGGAGFPLTGLVITGTRGFAFEAGLDQQQVWLTSDGGRHWTAVTVR
jgi:hypothetical protein